MKTTSSLRLLLSFAPLLLPPTAASFAVVVYFFLSAGFFPIPAVGMRKESMGKTTAEGREEELLFGLWRKNMGKWSRRQMNRVAPFFPALKRETRNRDATLQKVTFLP